MPFQLRETYREIIIIFVRARRGKNHNNNNAAGIYHFAIHTLTTSWGGLSPPPPCEAHFIIRLRDCCLFITYTHHRRVFGEVWGGLLLLAPPPGSTNVGTSDCSNDRGWSRAVCHDYHHQISYAPSNKQQRRHRINVILRHERINLIIDSQTTE